MKHQIETALLLIATVVASGCLPDEGDDVGTVEASIVYSDPSSLPDGNLVLTITDEMGDATPITQVTVPFTGGSPPRVVRVELPPVTIPPTIDIELVALDLSGDVIGAAAGNDIVVNPQGVTAVALFMDIPRRGGPRVLTSAQINGNPLVLVDDFRPAQVDCSVFGTQYFDLTIDDPESDPVQLSVRGQFVSASVGGSTADGPHALLGPVDPDASQTLAIDFGPLTDALVAVDIAAVQIPPGIQPRDGASFDQLSVTIDCRGQAFATPLLDDSGSGRRLLFTESVAAPATPHALSVTSTDDGSGFAVGCDASFKGPDGPASSDALVLDIATGDFVAIEPQANGSDYTVHYRDPARPNPERINASASIQCQASCTDDGVCAAPEVCGVCSDCGTCDSDGDAAHDLLVDWSFEEGAANGAAYDHANGGSHDGISVGPVAYGVPGFRGNAWQLDGTAGLGTPGVLSQGTPIPVSGDLTFGAVYSTTGTDQTILHAPGVFRLFDDGTSMQIDFETTSGHCIDTIASPGPGTDIWVVATWDGVFSDAEVWVNGLSDGEERCVSGNLADITTLSAGAEVQVLATGVTLTNQSDLTIDEVKVAASYLSIGEQCALWGMTTGQYGCP